MRQAVLGMQLVLVVAANSWSAPNETKITELAPGVYFRQAQSELKFTGCKQGWVVFKDYVLDYGTR